MVLDSGRVRGPGGGKAGPSESWWCPQSLTSSLCWWPMHLLLSPCPCSPLCPAPIRHVSRPLLSYPACISLYCHKHLVPHGMAAGYCCLCKMCLCCAELNRRKTKWVQSVVDLRRCRHSWSRREPSLQPQSRVQHCQPCSSVVEQIWFCA